MNVMAPMIITDKHSDEELMTRRQVAYLFRVTSAAVAIWRGAGGCPRPAPRPGSPRRRYRLPPTGHTGRSGPSRPARGWGASD